MAFADALAAAAKSYSDSSSQQSAWGAGVQGFGMPMRAGSPNAAVDAPTSYVVGTGSKEGGSMLWVVLGVAGVVLATVLIVKVL